MCGGHSLSDEQGSRDYDYIIDVLRNESSEIPKQRNVNNLT